MAWQDRLDSINQGFIRLSQREKGLLFLTTAFLMLYLSWIVWVEPMMKLHQVNQNTMRETVSLIMSLENQSRDIETALKVDPNEKIKQEIAELQAQLDEVEANLAQVMTEYVAPQKMAKELTRLLQTTPGVRVIGLEALPAKAIDMNEMSGLDTFYQHAFELTIAGDYFSLMAFVKKVTGQDKGFSIQDLHYRVLEHPNAELSLQLMTISDSQDVIRL